MPHHGGASSGSLRETPQSLVRRVQSYWRRWILRWPLILLSTKITINALTGPPGATAMR